MRLKKQKGFALITLILAMVLMTALGAGVYTLTTSSTLGELLTGKDYNAYQLAKSGSRYAAYILAVEDPTSTYTGGTYNMPDANHSFTISITTDGSGKKIITSRGNVNPNTFLAASRQLPTYALTLASGPTYSISFANDFPGFTSPVVSDLAHPGIVANTDTKTLTLGTNDTNLTGNYASLWYTGNNTTVGCVDGECPFGLGIRVFFNFTFSHLDYSTNSTNSADGFTFAIRSAITNTLRDITGGASSANMWDGELLGYAGPDKTTDSYGLKPPKMALEFDTYPNTAAPNNDTINNAPCTSYSRKDPMGFTSRHLDWTTFRNHAALMFWGSNATGTCTVNGQSYPSQSFDDNVHGAGSSGDDPYPLNATGQIGGGTSVGYYAGPKNNCGQSNLCNWMEDGHQYSARIEIMRPSMPTGGRYIYVINAWIYRDTEVAALSNSLQSRLKDVSVALLPADLTPHISRTVSFNQADHDNFRTIFLGFTEAEGGEVQSINLANLNIFFPLAALNCSYPLTPVSKSYAAPVGGATGQIVTVTPTNSSCPWTAVSNVGWIGIDGGAASSGTGTVTYHVDANTDPERTGTMTVAGQTFTVTQASGCTYAVSGVNTSLTSSAGHDDYSVTSSCSWTTSNGGYGWITFNQATSATRFDFTANTGIARSANITIAGYPFTVTQAGCLTLNSYSRNFTSSAGNNHFDVSGCSAAWTAVSNDSWITITSGSSGTGNGTVNYAVAANSGPARTGTITVAGLTFTVTQDSGCNPSISPTSQSFSSAGGSNTVAVTTGAVCTWTATESLAWVRIDSGSSGSGNGTVTYTVDPNTTNSSRTGDMTINGSTFTVNQARACSAYRVYNNTGSQYDFRVTGQTCHASVNNNNEITTSTTSTQLGSGETVSRYTTAGGDCSSPLQGDISYAEAVAANTDNNCDVNYNTGDVVGNR
jgi:hypothetical protein